MDLTFFNISSGFDEAVCRGLRSGFLTSDDYRRLSNCDNLEDFRSALEETDYGSFMQDEPSPLTVTKIVECAKQKMVDDFNFLYNSSSGDLHDFLECVRREKMIDNVTSIIQGSISNKPIGDIMDKIDQIGWCEEFKTIPTVDVSSGYDEIYKTILIDSPLGKYFSAVLTELSVSNASGVGGLKAVLDETDVEILRNLLKKEWLADFFNLCQRIGGNTSEVMGHILKIEADFKVILVTLNSLNNALGTSAQLSDRNNLYPSFGYLYPEGTDKICKAFNETSVRLALEPYANYVKMYDSCKKFYDKSTPETNEGKQTTASRKLKYKSIEDLLFVENVKLYELAFEQQYHYGVFYAWLKLREQEVRNLEWLCNMILMNMREHSDEIVEIFGPRI